MCQDPVYTDRSKKGSFKKLGTSEWHTFLNESWPLDYCPLRTTLDLRLSSSTKIP